MSGALFDHARDDLEQAIEAPVQVYGHDFLDPAHSELLHGAPIVQTGIGDEDIDLAESLRRGFD